MASLTLFCSCIQDLTSYLSSKVISYIFFFLSHFCGSLLGRSLVNSTVTVNHFLIVPISLQDQLKQAMLSKISPLRTQAHTQRENEKQIRPPQTTNAKHKYLGFQKNTLAECTATSFFSIFSFWTGFKCWKRYKTNHSNYSLKKAFFRTNKRTLLLKLSCLDIFKTENKKTFARKLLNES